MLQLFEVLAFVPVYFSLTALLLEIVILFALNSMLAEPQDETNLMRQNLKLYSLETELCGVGMVVEKKSMKKVVCKLVEEFF